MKSIEDREKDIAYRVSIWQNKKMNLPLVDLKACGVHEKYQPCDFNNFEGNDRIVTRLKAYESGGLVLRGVTGSGKTHLAVALMKHVYERRWCRYCDEWIEAVKNGGVGGNAPNLKMRFITVPNLLLEIREAFGNNSKRSERDLIEEFAAEPFLVLDDLGAEKGSEFAVTTLYVLIDRRDAEMKDTVITTNLTQENIEEKLNARIASRLSGWERVFVDMKDYRKKGK